MAIPRHVDLLRTLVTLRYAHRTLQQKPRCYGRRVVLVDGVRTPFAQMGTDYQDLTPYDLARGILQLVQKKTNLRKELVDYIVIGSVLQEIKTSNLAKEAALGAGFPDIIPAHTLAHACLSSNQAVTTGMNLISSGVCDTVLACGVELMSDIPIRHSRKMRQIMLEFNRAKTWRRRVALLSKMTDPSVFAPELPDVAEFSTGEEYGHSADRLAAAFSISREEQDDYAANSHRRAQAAVDKGYLVDVMPFGIPGSDVTITNDNGIRHTSFEAMTNLEPYFIKPHGTVTAANSSFLADGAAGCLLMSEESAKQQGFVPKAYIGKYSYVAQDPKDQMLLGEAHAIPRVLSSSGMTLKDIDLFELQETFAGQVLATIKSLDSTWFSNNCLGLQEKVGLLPVEKLNSWGGAIALGHPFSASGIRILVTLANRLLQEDCSLGLHANCASGGQGHAIILERHPDHPGNAS
ncbi:trifunctional enzyme subunit beta, mitochondrial-like [Lineus longissimus]|uniref:trifunctional enzyme subunit beta, mitochondrial-like n=1 Tax=Lineus longissimus TaxID=88925 RepID=UPI002B4DCFA4